MGLAGEGGFDRVEVGVMRRQVWKFVGVELVVLLVCLAPILASRGKQVVVKAEESCEEKVVDVEKGEYGCR